MLNTCQGIEADLLGGEILYVKERAELIIKIRKELENSQQRTKESQTKQYNKNYVLTAFKAGEKVLFVKERAESIIKIRKELENSW